MADIIVGCKIASMDETTVYWTEVEVNTAGVKKNRPSTTYEEYNNEFPTVIRNGITNYYSGTVSGNFSDNTSGDCVDENGYSQKYDFYDATYKIGFMDWLSDGNTKKLWLDDTYVIPVQITNETSGNGDYKISDPSFKVTFGWVQVGNPIGG